MPYPPIDGGSQLINNCTEGLIDCNVNLKVYSLTTSRILVDISKIPIKYVENTKLETTYIDTSITLTGAFLSLFRSQSYMISRFHSKKVEDNLISILSKEEFDFIQIEHLYMCLYIDVLRKHSKAKIIS